jgi:hypothetical protein
MWELSINRDHHAAFDEGSMAALVEKLQSGNIEVGVLCPRSHMQCQRCTLHACRSPCVCQVEGRRSGSVRAQLGLTAWLFSDCQVSEAAPSPHAGVQNLCRCHVGTEHHGQCARAAAAAGRC